MIWFPIIVSFGVALLAYYKFGDQMETILVWSLGPLWTAVILMMAYDFLWWEFF